MENNNLLLIADFSRYPSGRDSNDSTYNGEDYRKNILLPKIETAIEQGHVLTVSLRGVMSFGSSFLEEAFGGLVRKEGLSKADILSHLEIDPGKPNFGRYKHAILKYIKDAP